MIQVNVHEAKAKFSHLMDRVAKGERVIICKHNVPCMEWVPVQKPKHERQFGWTKGLIHIADDCFAPMTEEELKEIEEGRLGDPLRELMKPGNESSS